MSAEPDVREVAAALGLSVGMLVRRLRHSSLPLPAPVPAGAGPGSDDGLPPGEGGVTIPEVVALARLDRGGPATAAALARQEQISPQAMGATLAGLEARGLVVRRRDPADGRQIILSITASGQSTLTSRRDARTDLLARTLTAEFTAAEIAQLAAAAPLIERLAGRI